jgi:hypothetical protein
MPILRVPGASGLAVRPTLHPPPVQDPHTLTLLYSPTTFADHVHHLVFPHAMLTFQLTLRLQIDVNVHNPVSLTAYFSVLLAYILPWFCVPLSCWAWPPRLDLWYACSLWFSHTYLCTAPSLHTTLLARYIERWMNLNLACSHIPLLHAWYSLLHACG